MATFGQTLRELREKKGWSQDTLAEKIEVKSGKQTIGKWERDLTAPSLIELRKMAQVLDTTVGYLVDSVDIEAQVPKPGFISVPAEEYIELQRRVIRLQDEIQRVGGDGQ